jgi:hypothetical protein
VTVLLWDHRDPYRCACDGAYQPQLDRRGILVKKNEPAWRMMEQTRDRDCLQELVRNLAKAYRLRCQHHKTSKGSGAGYPDVHMWAPLLPGRGDVYIELKRMGEHPTDIQVQIMAELQDTHPDGRVRVYLVRPCCLLVGVVDELMADFAGVPCRYIEGNPGGPVFPIPPAEQPAARRAGRRRPAEPAAAAPARRLYREPALPGRDPREFTEATGIIVPQPGGGEVMRELEQWLRDAGFSPAEVPYPIRLVIGDGRLHVQCRRGLCRPGVDDRVWREGRPPGPFPLSLAMALRADVIYDPSSAKVEALIEAARPSATLPSD